MADIQAEIELTVELRKFFNIDLFVQGYYHIRAGVKFAPKVQTATKLELTSEVISTQDDSNDQIYPACIFNDWGVSKTFLIIYKNEEIELDDQFNFKLSVVLDAQNITDCFNRMDMQLFIELHFIDKEYSQEKLSTMQQLCSRCYKLHFNPRLGLHVHLPIFFDYFHLSAVTTTIHASLICLIPPYVFDRPNIPRTSLFSFLFGQDLSQITTDQLNPNLLDRAYQLHNTLCEILLSAYESLQDFYEKLFEQLPANERQPEHHHQKCRQKLKHLCEKLKTLDDIHTIDNLAHAHIAQCSAENIMLWGQFIQTFTFHQTAMNILAKEYHLKRVKRLSEGFFHRETSRINLLANESLAYNDFYELIRNSLYYSNLPHLPIECVELDGIFDTLPVLIEEVYLPDEEENSHGQINDNIQQIPTRKSSINSPLTSRVKNALVKGSTPPSPSSTHQSTKKPASPFRTRKSSNTNPLLALSNEPAVKLTSIRKLDDDSRLSSFSSTHHFQSARLTKSSRGQSLPDVSFHRSHSLTSSNVNHLESPIIPKFLCSTTNQNENNDEDVFLTTEQDQVVDAATFGDSSTKSKVLRESYRRKANTKDRPSAPPKPLRSLSTSATTSSHYQTRSFIKQVDHQPTGSVNAASLESVLDLTLQLEKSCTNDLDPLLLNGLTDEENQLNAIEKATNQKLTSYDYDRIQTNSTINSQTIGFVVHKEKFKDLLSSKNYSNLLFYSDYSTPISPVPYFSQEIIPYDSHGLHLIVCVHGLDGNSADLRLIKTYLELCLPTSQLDFLMSSANHSTTFDSIDVMVKHLIDEIDSYIDIYHLRVKRLSFVGHSLGNLIIRATVAHERFKPYRKLLYTYLSLSGPHLGTLYNTSGLVNTGMWLMQKWKKSISLAQMSVKDHLDPRKTFVYNLSKQPCLEFFKNILLVASSQDRYVPFHSARIEMCKSALTDTVHGSVYVEMFHNLLDPIIRNPSITFVRYSTFHNIPSGTNNLIGRAAHIAILDSELFVEKLISISAAKYFK